jgi:hypothetical protein
MERRNCVSIDCLSALLVLLAWQVGTPAWAGAGAPGVPIHVLGSDGFVRDWLILGQFPNPKEKLASPDGAYRFFPHSSDVATYFDSRAKKDSLGRKHRQNEGVCARMGYEDVA